MSDSHEVVAVGAAILGLAGADHILQADPDLDLLIMDRLPGPGRGNTSSSAAVYRDMLSFRINRPLSQGSTTVYEQIQRGVIPIGLKKIGYLWLMTVGLIEASRTTLEAMAQAGVKLASPNLPELKAHLPDLRAGDIGGGILGLNRGILIIGRPMVAMLPVHCSHIPILG